MTNPTTITAQPGEPFVDIERVIDAPIEVVYRAHMEPELMAKWLGPRGYDMDVTRYDVRDGGSYAFVHTNPEGERFGFRGSFHSIEPNERVIRTFEYEGAPGHVSLESVVFEDLGGKTRLTTRSAFQSVEDRDAMVASGMSRGVTEGYERLDELLEATAL
jgi:uncharacterized protein YndB with AHSA1/START domain